MKTDFLNNFSHNDSDVITVVDESGNHVITCPWNVIDNTNVDIEVGIYGPVGDLFVTYDAQEDVYIIVW